MAGLAQRVETRQDLIEAGVDVAVDRHEGHTAFLQELDRQVLLAPPEDDISSRAVLLEVDVRLAQQHEVVSAPCQLPLTRWFLAMHLLTQSKNNVAALELMRHLGVCYKTAWLLKHKLMEVMRVREDSRVLDDALPGNREQGDARPGAGPTERRI